MESLGKNINETYGLWLHAQHRVAVRGGYRRQEHNTVCCRQTWPYNNRTAAVQRCTSHLHMVKD